MTREEAEQALAAAGTAPDDRFPLFEACLSCALHENPARDAAMARGLADEAADPRCASPKGEIVVLVGPGRETAASPEEAEQALAEALTRAGPAEAAAEVAKALGLPRRDLYRQALALKGADR